MLEKFIDYPLSMQELKKWTIEKIKNSNKGEFTEEFEAYLESENVHTQMLDDVLKHNPGVLFSMLDRHNVFVSVFRNFETNRFGFSIDGVNHAGDYSVREDANKAALIHGIQVLETNLLKKIEVTE